MQDIFDLGSVPYLPAEPLRKRSWSEKLIFFSSVFCDIIKTLVLSTPNWFLSLYHCIISPPKKCVKQQTVLITGGGNGIGRALAFRLAKEGCNIVIADIEWEAAKATTKALLAKNVIAKAYHVDIGNADQVKKLKCDIERDIAPVDILINNAGIMPLLSIREGTEIEIERIVKVNITSHYTMVRTFLPGMIDRKRGHIVGMSSVTAVHPMPGTVIYTSTKFAVHGFIRALYEELRQDGIDFIKLTSVLPYFVSTRKDLMATVNLRFPVITPEEVADVTVDAMLRNELIVSVPRCNLWISSILSFLPLSNQNLIRDHVLKERETRQMFYVEKDKLVGRVDR